MKSQGKVCRLQCTSRRVLTGTKGERKRLRKSGRDSLVSAVHVRILDKSTAPTGSA